MLTKVMSAELAEKSKLPENIYKALSDKLAICLGSAMIDAKNSGDKVVSLNIGIGTLSVDLTDLQYKFIPSKDLKQIIKDGAKKRDFALDSATLEKLNKQLGA